MSTVTYIVLERFRFSKNVVRYNLFPKNPPWVLLGETPDQVAAQVTDFITLKDQVLTTIGTMADSFLESIQGGWFKALNEDVGNKPVWKENLEACPKRNPKHVERARRTKISTRE